MRSLVLATLGVFALGVTGCSPDAESAPVPRPGATAALAQGAPEPGPGVAGEDSAAAAPEPETREAVDPALLAAWVEAVGGRKANESFGDLVVRAAAAQLGRTYHQAPESSGPEWVHADLSTFHCVSLVESSVALSRCLWKGASDAACFLGEIEHLRYRGGRLDGFASRLHYWTDWLEDNASRKNITLLTPGLGGKSVELPFFYVTAHADHYPPLGDPEVRALVATRERELSAEAHVVIGKGQVARALASLRTGDIVAIVGQKPGILVSHTGLVDRGKDGVVRLLHASSHHHRVLLTKTDIADYVRRRPERRGLMVARPLPPSD